MTTKLNEEVAETFHLSAQDATDLIEQHTEFLCDRDNHEDCITRDYVTAWLLGDDKAGSQLTIDDPAWADTDCIHGVALSQACTDC